MANNNGVIDLTSNRRPISTSQFVFDLTNEDDEENQIIITNNNQQHRNKRGRSTITEIIEEEDEETTNVGSKQTTGTTTSTTTTTLTSTTTTPPKPELTPEEKINAALSVLEQAMDGTLNTGKGNTNNRNGGGVGITKTFIMNKLISFIPCPICLSTPITNITSTKCGHVFCKRCIDAAIQATRKCAVCNTALKPKETHPLYL